MKNKLVELKGLMKKTGFRKSLEIMEDLLAEDEEQPNATQPGAALAGKSNITETNQLFNPGMGKVTGQNSVIVPADSNSELMVYTNAVGKRISTSSEDDMVLELSDESLNNSNAMHNFVGEAQPGSSGHKKTITTPSQKLPPTATLQQPELITPEERTFTIIKEVEAAKAKIFPSQANEQISNFEFIAKMDQDYSLVGSHVDELTQAKIICGEYIDFGKLIPKERIISEEEGNKMELIIKGGRTYWAPVTESLSINGFSRWEQAFRIFSDIYTRAYPQKSTELIQYNHIIHSIAGTYVWENVYSYDKEFRLHLSKHPDRNWGVILQQAWSMKLKDRLNYAGSNQNQQFSSTVLPQSGHKGKNFAEACRRYNHGKCKFGTRCRYEHKCSYCGKTGHMILTCRKLIADCERNTSKKETSETN